MRHRTRISAATEKDPESPAAVSGFDDRPQDAADRIGPDGDELADGARPAKLCRLGVCPGVHFAFPPLQVLLDRRCWPGLVGGPGRLGAWRSGTGVGSPEYVYAALGAQVSAARPVRASGRAIADPVDKFLLADLPGRSGC
jgi:hypothetical protein